jgi:hypothetical protein
MNIVKLEAESPVLELIELDDISDQSQLGFLQEIVGGYIEYLALEAIVEDLPEVLRNVDIIMNEEGKIIDGLKPNLLFDFDVIMGTVIFVSITKEGDTEGLTQEQLNVLPSVVNKLRVPSEAFRKKLSI